MKKNNFCQSCGMPLSKDPKKGGSEKDGSKSNLYCSLCYQEGSFLQSNITAKEMQVFCIEQMKKQGMSSWKAWLFTRGIPHLQRWKG